MKRQVLQHSTGRFALAVLLVATSALAQPATSDDSTSGMVGGGGLTAQEQMTQAGHYVTTMKGTRDQVQTLSKRAQRDKDIIKLNCVNAKLVEVKGSVKLGEQLVTGLRAAIVRNDTGTRNHEFSKLTIVYQKVVVLGQEAEACIGEDVAFVGETRVTVVIDPNITKGDPTEEPQPDLPVTRPPLASPFD